MYIQRIKSHGVYVTTAATQIHRRESPKGSTRQDTRRSRRKAFGPQSAAEALGSLPEGRPPRVKGEGRYGAICEAGQTAESDRSTRTNLKPLRTDHRRPRLCRGLRL